MTGKSLCLLLFFLHGYSGYLPILLRSHRIGRQNEMISNAHRSVLETEEMGMEITSELARNREKIESSRAKVAYSSFMLCYAKLRVIQQHVFIAGC